MVFDHIKEMRDTIRLAWQAERDISTKDKNGGVEERKGESKVTRTQSTTCYVIA